MTRVKICCIKLSLGTRVIAMFGLIISVLVLTQLGSELMENNQGEDTGATIGIILGLDINQAVYMYKSNEINLKVVIMIACLVYALIYAIASAILVWGSIVESSWCAFPWLVCEAFSFIGQIATIVSHSVLFRGDSEEKWILLITIVNLCLTVYFWIVVFQAQRSWARQTREAKENETISTTSNNSRTLTDDVFEPNLPSRNIFEPNLPPNKHLDVV